MIIEKKLIKEYKNFNLYGIYKDKKLLYKTCGSNIKELLETDVDDVIKELQKGKKSIYKEKGKPSDLSTILKREV